MDKHIRRILIVEKMIMMPVKLSFILLTFLFVWAPDQEFQLISKNFLLYQMGLYIVANLIFFFILNWAEIHQWAVASIKTTAFLLSIIDNLYLSFLIPVTGGLESPLYWIYIGLIVRNAINFPKIGEQGVINLAFCVFYGGVVYISEHNSDLFMREIYYLRIIVLILVSICCWGIYALLQRKTEELEEARELQLRREKIHAVRRLAGEIAHGVKNPLGIINNASYYLEKHISDNFPELRKHVDMIRSEVTRSDQILNEIMNYSKLSSTKLVKINVNTILKHILEDLHPDTSFPEIRIEKQFQKNLPVIFFDEGHLKQILSNLILNATEAIKEKAFHSGVLILTTSVDSHENITISISDNGVGISEEEINKIFEPFFTTKNGGTGLGLSIVKNLIETYDGSIEVRSEKNKGSMFIVRLPLLMRNKV